MLSCTTWVSTVSSVEYTSDKVSVFLYDEEILLSNFCQRFETIKGKYTEYGTIMGSISILNFKLNILHENNCGNIYIFYQNEL